MAVYPDEAIHSHLAFLARRRALRPSEEYRTPTDEEWQEFLGHFERRKASIGTCARAFATPCMVWSRALSDNPGASVGDRHLHDLAKPYGRIMNGGVAAVMDICTAEEVGVRSSANRME
ncbi:MAG TPA: hypothetical protein VF062_17690 [Candidatus Limnocylindrales bacterium]